MNIQKINNPAHEVGIFTSSNSWSGITANDYVKGLLSGGLWGDKNPDDGDTTDLYYYRLEGNFSEINGEIYGYQWSPYEWQMVQKAMESFSDVANISFTETNQSENANIIWALLDNLDSGGDDTLGWSYQPLPSNQNSAGITTLNWESYKNFNSLPLNPGSYYHLTFLHELGHSLGLEHPHESNSYYGVFPGVSGPSDSGDNKLNGSPWTVMTYNDLDPNIGYSPTFDDLSGFLTSLGAFDIAAIQYLYGANKTTNSEDNIYELTSSLNGYECIWDVGGNDTIDASNASGATTIDLRNATLNNESGGGGYVSSINSEKKGFTIAHETNDSSISCVIENAKGSNFNDIITGNSSSNKIEGGSGTDTLKGGKGDDTLDGGSGIDTSIFTGNFADYSFSLDSANGAIQIADSNSLRDGTDTVTQVESFIFNGTTYGADNVLIETGFNLYGYLASNLDLLTAFKDNTNSAAQHYINHGYAEGRNTTDFNPTNYLNNYADLTAAFGSNTEAATRHYISNGYAEGRTDSPKDSGSGGSSDLTDLEAYNYIASNNDLISAFGIDIAAAKSHYTNHGKSEGRSLTRFSASVYLEKYGDLKAAFGDDQTSALKHYIQHGYAEGRTDSSKDSGSGESGSGGSGSGGSSNLTDLEAYNYIASNNDLISAFGTDIAAAKNHYINHGKAEGRPLDNFDEWGYLASNKDLLNAFGKDATKAIKHYISYGKSEGRLTNLFNAESYLNSNSDLRNAFGNDLDAAKKHFVEHGFNEGRFY